MNLLQILILGYLPATLLATGIWVLAHARRKPTAVVVFGAALTCMPLWLWSLTATDSAGTAFVLGELALVIVAGTASIRTSRTPLTSRDRNIA